ncbi:uncharacterized protein LOC143280953 isoform X3 [Babylonia areolata]|uniref:uncharacterized protein LOC143280953 isoform X3 n=1 Tax=Babylonia areolata TaxID=304850 RepID=UPI003FD5800D
MAAFGTMPTQRFKLMLLLLMFGAVFATASQISDLRRCGDKACSVTLSRATVLARYPSNNPLLLSLNRGDVVDIKSKSAGTRPELWGGEVNGRRGYFPKAFVKEFSVKIEKPLFEVPTEENLWSKQPPPPHQQQQQQVPQQETAQQSDPQSSQEPPSPAVNDETEIDETDWTDMDETEMDEIPQEEPPKEEAPATEMPGAEDMEGKEEKEGEPKEEAKGGWLSFSDVIRDPLLKSIEDLQRSFMRDEDPMDPKVLNDFLARQFGSEGAASTSSPSDTEGDKAQPGEDAAAAATTAAAEDPQTRDVGAEVDLTDLGAAGQPSPADGAEGEETIGGEAQEQEEQKEENMEKERQEKKDDKMDEQKEEEKEENAEEQKEEEKEKKVEEQKEEEKEEKVEEQKEEEKVEEQKEEEKEEKVEEQKKEEKEEKVEEQKQEEKEEKMEEQKQEEKEEKEEEEQDSPYISGVTVLEDEEEEEEEEDPKYAYNYVGTIATEKAPESEEDRGPEESSQDRAQAEDHRTGSTEEGNKGQGEDSTVTDSRDPTDMAEEDHKEEEAAQTATESSQPPPADSAAAAQKDSPQPQPIPPQVERVDPASKLSNPNVQEAGAGQQEEKDTVPVDQVDLGQKAQQDTAAVTGGSPDDFVSSGPSEGVEGMAEGGDGKQQAGLEDRLPQEEDHRKSTEEDIGGEKEEEEETPTVVHADALDRSSPVKETSIEDTSQEDVPDKSGDEGKEEEEKLEIQPDKTVSEPPPPSSSGYQPVDIGFVAGRVEEGGVTLDSSQSPAQQLMPTRTPALQDSPSMPDQPGMTETAADQSSQSAGGGGDQAETTLIDGTRFYLVDGEPGDIVPESVAVDRASGSASEEVETSAPPARATEDVDIQPTVTNTLPHVSSLNDVPASQTQNDSRGAAADSQREQLDKPQIDDSLLPKVGMEQYQTNADSMGRKMLSVNTQIPPKVSIPKDAPPAEQDIRKTQEQDKTLDHTKTLTSQIQPSVAVDTPASVTIEGEEPSVEEPKRNVKADDGSAAARADQEKDGSEASSGPPVGDNWVTKLSSDADTDQDETRKAQVVEGGSSKDEAGDGDRQEEAAETATPPSSDHLEWDNVPPPPTEDHTTPGDKQMMDEPTVEGDPYQMDDYYGRKITDEKLSKAEESGAGGYPSSVGSLEAQSTAFIEKLPPSIQSLLEQEPLGLSPGMTVLVTVTAFVVFLAVSCFSCLCSSGSKKAGTKDPLVVVRELEEKLLMAVKEKENLEDALQERQAETKRMKLDMSDLQSKSGSMTSELQTVKLHNEALKTEVSTLSTKVSELQDQLSRKTDDVKTKDKKTKDIEKETKKLQEAKKKLEQNLQKTENERQSLEGENENLKTAVQSLTDQVQLLDTSKQQLLAEADDWKEKVGELKERIDQMEQENRQAQETISFKDSELEVMKDCYLQLKEFEKGGTEGEDEDFETQDRSKDVQEKIQAMMDVSKVNATLRTVQEEKDNLGNRLKIENDARKELEEQLECVRREMESSMADKMKAERQSQEAETKLVVLTAYFKDKEMALQRELGEHEALKKQNLSKLDSADENTRTLQKELEMSRQQVESLKRELTASERDFRSQIASNEKKAHENWLNARAAERELKETRHEAAVLRQKLTDLERRQMDLIRPLPTRGMPPPGMLNGPPPPGMERSPSRGSIPPGAMPPGPMPPPFREGDFAMSPRDRERLPPSHPARHMPPPPPDARSPPPRMMPPDSRGSPPRMPPPPPDARSPPPYDRRGPPPPHPMDSRSPPMRLPPPDMVPPPMRGPLPPRGMGHPPMGSPGPRMDSPRDPRQGPPYGRPPPPPGEGRRHQSQV